MTKSAINCAKMPCYKNKVLQKLRERATRAPFKAKRKVKIRRLIQISRVAQAPIKVVKCKKSVSVFNRHLYFYTGGIKIIITLRRQSSNQNTNFLVKLYEFFYSCPSNKFIIWVWGRYSSNSVERNFRHFSTKDQRMS